MKLEGTLDAFGLPDLFSLLRMTGKTGTLHVWRTDGSSAARAAVHVVRGEVTGATPEVGSQVLARRLVGVVEVPDEALVAAVQAAASSDVGVARALVEAEALDVAVVRGVAQEQTRDAVFDLLRWPEGAFSFVVDEAGRDEVGISLSSETLVAETAERLARWREVSAVVPDGASVPTPCAPSDGEVTLRARELALLSLLDGRRSVRDVVALSGRGEFAVVEDLAGLVERGLVALDATSAADTLQRRSDLLRAAETSAPDAATSPAAGGEPAGAAVPSGGHAAVAPPRSVTPAAAVPAAAVPSPRSQELPPLRPQESRVLETPRAAVGPPQDVRAEVATDRHGGRPVTPVRPEVLAPRTPDHPEPLPLVAPGSDLPPTAGATALAPALGDAAIGIDPEVTRTMLMRLIAGVRGL